MKVILKMIDVRPRVYYFTTESGGRETSGYFLGEAREHLDLLKSLGIDVEGRELING